ncbi:MAG TPA: aminotransferase class I/II-fold pyridoxal phosphate-dependent enzyme [Mycobacterium sp.]|nr:aminotransferase class I/II-fold pyridoxal phosphate-dependent enzyme [Mycobacterium sp.]
MTIDLSTCVNRYGPPPAALDALRRVKPVDLLMHPYDAADRLRDVYARTLGVDADELLTSRAASEIIWAMGRRLEPRAVAIPLPAYTDYLRAFPRRGFGPATGCGHTIGQLDAALKVARVVLISNPHNPTGSVLGPDELTALALRHPRSVLVVDESYVEFVRDPAGASMVGCPADNVVVLRSASKFYGIAATRAGVAWCRNRHVLNSLVGAQETWGLSGLDVTVAAAALTSHAWATEVRTRLLADSRWLAGFLDWLPGVQLRANDQVHFQFAHSQHAPALAAALADQGVGIRVLGRTHGIAPGALRVVAPRHDERDRVAAAFAMAASATAADNAPPVPVGRGASLPATVGTRR